jgi:hypothetical protein
MLDLFTLEKTKYEHVTSTNKHVVDLCSSVREGTSKLTNKLYYLYQKNKRRGVHYVLISLEILKREINRSEDSIRRYIAEAEAMGLIIVEKKRDRLHKLRYKFTLTQKFLNIKKCGTLLEDNSLQDIPKTVPIFYTQKPQNAAKKSQNAGIVSSQNPQKTRACEVFSDPLYLDISFKRLNKGNEGFNQTAIEQEIQPSDFEMNPITDDLQTDPPPLELQEHLSALEIITSKLDTPLEIKENLALRAIQKLMKSHFGTGKTGFDNWRAYLTKFSNTPFLMGKKPMKSGDFFTSSVGAIFSVKNIEDSWKNEGFFKVYEEKPFRNFQKDNMPKKVEPVKTPFLSELFVVETAHSPFDERVKHYLYTNLGELLYKSWFHAYDFVATGENSGEIEFIINTRFARDYITTHFREKLKKAVTYANRTH